MMAESERRIVQIIPATGWRALYVERGAEGEVELFTKILAVWALVEQRGSDGVLGQSVEGMDGGEYLDTCEEQVNFVAYLEPDDDPELWRVAAEGVLAGLERRHARREKGKHD